MRSSRKMSISQSVSKAINDQSNTLLEYSRWLEQHMPKTFFEGLDTNVFPVIAQMLASADHFGEYIHINLKNYAIVLSLEKPGSDVNILRYYEDEGIQDYKSYTSNENFAKRDQKLQVTILSFTKIVKEAEADEKQVRELAMRLKSKNDSIDVEDCIRYLTKMNKRFLSEIDDEKQLRSYELYKGVQETHRCQYWDIRPKLNEKGELETWMGFAWENAPKHHFLYRLSEICSQHNLGMVESYVSYIEPLKTNGILMSWFHLRGEKIWPNLPIDLSVDMKDFIREIVTAKTFPHEGILRNKLVKKGIVTGNQANLLNAISYFIESALVNVSDIYTLDFIKNAFVAHSDLTKDICALFGYRFDPRNANEELYEKYLAVLSENITKLDTGYAKRDKRRRNVFRMALVMIQHILKTNHFMIGKLAIGFRMDPNYLNCIPDFDRKTLYPAIPFGIFFIAGLDYFAFQVRFRDLARGGMRTVITRSAEHSNDERGTIFSEIYNLAYTQQKKNKDIPEGGSKAIIFLEPDTMLPFNIKIVKNELKNEGFDAEEIKKTIARYTENQKVEHVFQAQRSFVKTLISLVNHKDGKLIPRNSAEVIDRYGKIENIYLGPDENCSNAAIKWIAGFSRKKKYEPGAAFISAKEIGINHKEFGVTSLGVFQYLVEGLKYLGKEPKTDKFTVKITGGPDGDVAGNMMLLLRDNYKETCKLLAVKDGYGTCYDPQGLDLDELSNMFYRVEAIDKYPPAKLHNGGFLLVKNETRMRESYHMEVLQYVKENGIVKEKWMGASAASKLYNRHLHSVGCDVFIPCGGRPKTLNEENYRELLAEAGSRPTCKLICEGANLYITQKTREIYEDMGVMIFKDSSANKGGVISSSYEIIAGLSLTDEQFLANKAEYVTQVKERIAMISKLEAKVILAYHKKNGGRLTAISEKVSEKINFFFDQVYEAIREIELSKDPQSKWNRIIVGHCPKVMERLFLKELLTIPESHKKAIIAVSMACNFVYNKGIDWSPSVADLLPIIFPDEELFKKLIITI